MNRDAAKKYMRERAVEYLKPDKSRKGFICPVCGSGSGKNGTGISTKDGIHFTCWAGCFSNEDMIDIIGKEYNLSEYNDKLYKAAELFNITIEPYRESPQNPIREYFGRAEGKIMNNEYKSRQERSQSPERLYIDYTDFFSQAAERLGETEYHRGISLDTLYRFNVGYVAEWRHPNAPNAPTSPRLIIPTSRQSYLARDTRADLTELQQKYSKSKVGKVQLFNKKALKEATKPIFIVEGEIDALSIIDVGGEAVALGSISNKRALIATLENERPAQPLIIAMDNDESGIKANRELVEELERLRIPFYRLDIFSPHKDANEALNADREAFISAVEQAENIEAETLEAEREQIRREAAFYSLSDFIGRIEQSEKFSFVPTGFDILDNLLDGGLYAGLYVVGAISSLGKTTFCLQVADQVAQSGRDVLIFSLEMPRDELIAKSISRITFIENMRQNGSTDHAKTTRGIMTGTRYAGYSQKERDLIRGSVTAYGKYAKNIYITEGMGNIGVGDIRDKVQKHVKTTGRAPVVLIDYLQIIAPSDMRATDKQNTDKAVLELKRMSRDYNIPIIGISSFNRDNYSAPVNLTSFKESGAIEYSSDVLIGLQYYGMDYQEGEADKAREKRIRELTKSLVNDGKNGRAQKIQIKILKNRNGSKGEALLNFYPMFNYFESSSGGIDNGGSWSRSEGGYK